MDDLNIALSLVLIKKRAIREHHKGKGHVSSFLIVHLLWQNVNDFLCLDIYI